MIAKFPGLAEECSGEQLLDYLSASKPLEPPMNTNHQFLPMHAATGLLTRVGFAHMLVRASFMLAETMRDQKETVQLWMLRGSRRKNHCSQLGLLGEMMTVHISSGRVSEVCKTSASAVSEDFLSLRDVDFHALRVVPKEMTSLSMNT